jgi:hypothetical protein
MTFEYPFDQLVQLPPGLARELSVFFAAHFLPYYDGLADRVGKLRDEYAEKKMATENPVLLRAMEAAWLVFASFPVRPGFNARSLEIMVLPALYRLGDWLTPRRALQTVCQFPGYVAEHYDRHKMSGDPLLTMVLAFVKDSEASMDRGEAEGWDPAPTQENNQAMRENG